MFAILGEHASIPRAPLPDEGFNSLRGNTPFTEPFD
jgi:hypothetical protein